MGVSSFVMGLEKGRDERVRVIFGVGLPSMEPPKSERVTDGERVFVVEREGPNTDEDRVSTFEECQTVGLSSMVPTWVTDGVCVFRRHVGYLMYPTPQELHVVPVNPIEQLHVHAVLPTFDVTNDACPLQCVAVAHRVHVG